MPKKNTNHAGPVMRFYWNRVRTYPYTITGIALVLPVTILFSQFLPPLILADALRKLSNHQYIPGQPWQSFGHDIIIYIAITLIGGLVLWRLVDLLVWHLEGSVERDIAQKVYGHLMDQSAAFHANRFSGTLVSQTNKILSSYVRIADTTIFGTIPLLLSVLFASIILFSRSHLYVAALIVFSLLYMVTAYFVSRKVREAGAVHADAESNQTGYLADSITNVMAIKSFSHEQAENHTFKKVSEHTHRKLMDVMRAHQKQMAYFSSANSVISAASFIIAIVGAVNYRADIATMFLILNYTATIISQLFSFGNNHLRNYNRAVGDASAMVETLNTPAEVLDPAVPETAHMTRGAIEFKNVTFTHKQADNSIFHKLNLRVKPGEKVGLIGHSGSGKTSLTRILLRFSDIDSGAITIDGQNIAHVSQADLRSVISYVPQEPLLFHRSIRENIGYGRPGATEQEIEIIARQAHAAEFVAALPEGYETLVGERGVKLSGGQRQRVAIARAMIKNAPILVLDEATSALDSESEALIQDALWTLMEGRTAIVIAHRLSTIQNMDRIIVMEDGHIVEQGSHKDLIRNSGVYADLWNRQSGGFIDD